MALFLSVIVPTVRSPSDLSPILTNLINTLPDHSEIVIVDDSAEEVDWYGCLRAQGLLCNSREIPVRFLVNAYNSGPGKARNVGIDAAEGVYVCFVDDDDAIVEGPFRNLRESNIAGSDVVLMGFRDTSGVMTADAVHAPLPCNVRFASDLLYVRYLETGFLPLQCQAFLFSTAFLRSECIRFPETYLGEDLTFNVLALLRAQHLLYVDAPYYVYNSRGGTLKSAIGLDRSYDFLMAACYLADSTLALSAVKSDFRRATLRRLVSLFLIRLCQVTHSPQLSMSVAKSVAGHPWVARLPEDDGFYARIISRLSALGDTSNAALSNNIVESFRSMFLPAQSEARTIYVYCTGPLGYFFATVVFSRRGVRFVDDSPSGIARARALGHDATKGSDLPGLIKAGDVVIIANIQRWIAVQILAQLTKNCDPKILDTISIHTPEELFAGLPELNRYLEAISRQIPMSS